MEGEENQMQGLAGAGHGCGTASAPCRQEQHLNNLGTSTLILSISPQRIIFDFAVNIGKSSDNLGYIWMLNSYIV